MGNNRATRSWAGRDGVYAATMAKVTLPAVAALRQTTSKLIARIGGRLQGGSAGQGMVEYALILMLVALVIIVIMTVLGGHVSNLYSNIANGIPG